MLEGLWIGNNVTNTVNKRFYELTFRLVLVKHWLRNLLRGNVCSTNVVIRIGNAIDVRDAKNVFVFAFIRTYGLHAMSICIEI